MTFFITGFTMGLETCRMMATDGEVSCLTLLKSYHRHHPHHIETRGLAAPSPSNQAPCHPCGQNGRQGRRRSLGSPPRRPSPPDEPHHLGPPRILGRRSATRDGRNPRHCQSCSGVSPPPPFFVQPLTYGIIRRRRRGRGVEGRVWRGGG
jgi:hypothetical protein